MPSDASLEGKRALVTRVAGFPASPEASYVNGVMFVVDGGESL